MYTLADISIFNAIAGQTPDTRTPKRTQKRDYRENKTDAINGLNRITQQLGSWYNALHGADTGVSGQEKAKDLRSRVRNVVDTVDRGIQQYKSAWHSQAFFDDPQFKAAYKEASKARARLVNLYNTIVAPESAKKGFWSNLDSLTPGTTDNLTDVAAMRAKTRMFNAVHKLVEAARSFSVSYNNAKEYYTVGQAYRNRVAGGNKPPKHERPSAQASWLIKELGKDPVLAGPKKINSIVQWAKHSSWYRKNCSPEALLTRALETIDKAATTETAGSSAKEDVAAQQTDIPAKETETSQPQAAPADMEAYLL